MISELQMRVKDGRRFGEQSLKGKDRDFVKGILT